MSIIRYYSIGVFEFWKYAVEKLFSVDEVGEILELAKRLIAKQNYLTQ